MRGKASGFVVAAAWLAACGTNDGTAGLSGRQVVSGDDVADLFFASSTMLAFTRQSSNPTDERPQDLWAWKLTDGEPAVGLTGIDWAPPVWWPRLLIGDLLETGTSGRVFYDFGVGHGTDLTSFGPAASVAEASEYGAVTAVRRGAGIVAVTGRQRGHVGVGRPGDLQSLTLDGAIASMDFLGTDLAMLFVPTTDAEPTAGLYKLTLPTGELTALIPTSSLADWEGTLDSCTPFDNACSLFRVVGCNQSDPPCPGSGRAPCFVLYAKHPADNPDITAAFAYDVNSRGITRMPGQNPRSFAVSPDQHTIIWDSETDPEARPGILTPRFWDLCSNVEALCPDATFGQISWRPGGTGFALLDFDGSLRVANGDLCVPAAPRAYLLQYSPSGDRLMWLGVDEASGDQSLWLSWWDGSAAEQLASGNISGARFTSDGQRLILARRSQDTSSLSWLDLSVRPAPERRLADNYGGFSRGGARRLLLVDHWNSQDTSGDLVLLDIASGVRHPLGRAVTEFAVSGDVDNGGAIDVAYVVHSRVPAARDGLWLTALPP